MLSMKRISGGKSCLSQLYANAVYPHRQRCSKAQKKFYEPEKLEPDQRVVALRDKLLYCDYLDKEKVQIGYLKRRISKFREKQQDHAKRTHELMNTPVYSIMLDHMMEKENATAFSESTSVNKNKPVYMPYAHVDQYNKVKIVPEEDKDSLKPDSLNEKQKVLYEKYLEAKKATKLSKRQMTFADYINENENAKMLKGDLSKVPLHWMTDYEQFDDTLQEDENWQNFYGTCNPHSHVSPIPCGGCGALLHCKDPGIPGYLPSELFGSGDAEDLKVTTCQRCHFLKFYNTALEVKVSAEEYPKLLEVIKTKTCAVILIIDLTDFPCSIWRDIKSILQPFTSIFLVGNKVDLLPRDSPQFLSHVEKCLYETVQEFTGIDPQRIMHVGLVSAKTGYGIEELINKLQNKWGNRGDIYMIGCTNVGKSSMFNALLNSDFCRVQAIDLIQRATISPWPGTTLNLLKFPMAYPDRKKLALRAQRLSAESLDKQLMERYRCMKLKDTRNIELATLQGYIGRTFQNRNPNASGDPFSDPSHKVMYKQFGLDETIPGLENSRWCYDTPGTIHSDQILDLLTTDELLTVLSRRIISPRTFVLRPAQTMFLGGIGRLDYVEGDSYMRCTLFASRDLPITICCTVHADTIYDELSRTEAFAVPTNNPERLKSWPALKPKELSTTGISNDTSAADVVLSSAGWIAVTPKETDTVTLRAWTPQGRGIYLRSPALLPKSVTHRGKRVGETPMYRAGREVYIPMK